MTTLKEFARQRRSQLSRDKRLINAVSAGSIKRVRLLLSRGADPNAQDWWGDTPLHWACRLGREDLAKLLLSHGADPNTPGCLDIVISFPRRKFRSSPARKPRGT
ncbi:MAG: ankyrin repeat domain-containing protein [Syntrophorhabdaceae bacterium]